MTRNSAKVPMNAAAVDEVASPPRAAVRSTHPDSPMDGSFNAARAWTRQTLLAAQDFAGWLESWQRQGVHAVAAWVETFAMGAREAERADGFEALLAVPAHMMNRQLESDFRRVGEGMQRLLDGELEWMDEWREQAGTVVGALTPGASPPGGDGLTALLEPWGRALGEWRAAGERWAQAMAAPASR